LHGGGFVSQTSASHSEAYLRSWSAAANVPIFCLDYSTAPEAPFPRAVEETLYAYCWMRDNFASLGEKMTFAHYATSFPSSKDNFRALVNSQFLEIFAPLSPRLKRDEFTC